MAETLDYSKLQMFEQTITGKAKAERDEIVKETERIKKLELDKEENRLLEELYARIQTQITNIKTEHTKNISRETLKLKKELFRKREEYLDKLVAEVRAKLIEFCAGQDYLDYLKRKCTELKKLYPLKKTILRVRSQDMAYAELLRGTYGDCSIEADDAEISIGGIVLVNHERGLVEDSSLDAALREERERFYSNPNFQIDPTGGVLLE